MSKLFNTSKSIETTTKIDNQTGEIIETKETRVTKIAKTPDFVMLFIEDIKGLCGLTGGEADCLFKLLKYTIPTNLLNITGYMYTQISEELEVSVQQVRNYISKLTKKEILFRKGSGTYILNPHLFGKGNWTDVQELRLEITYTAKKPRTIKVKKSKKITDTEMYQPNLPLIKTS